MQSQDFDLSGSNETQEERKQSSEVFRQMSNAQQLSSQRMSATQPSLRQTSTLQPSAQQMPMSEQQHAMILSASNNKYSNFQSQN